MGSKKMGFKSQSYAGKSKAKPFPKTPPARNAKRDTVLPHKGK